MTIPFKQLLWIILLASYFQLCAVPVYAGITTKGLMEQEKKITGKVTNKAGEPVQGVTVLIKGTTIGGFSGVDGTYSITAPSSAEKIVFSFIGMRTVEAAIGAENTINIVLEEIETGLNEVVVIGYGTSTKKDLTGSVTAINETNIKKFPNITIDQKLVGQIPGVQVQQVTGAPGGGTSVKIRGAGSLGAGNEPLYIVDGMPYSSGLNQNLNPLIFINPDDIESISVLKDASSTAIYGSRGANGIIIITTKKGKLNQTQLNVSAKFGIQQVPEQGKPEMMNAREFADYQREQIGVKLKAALGRDPIESDYPVEYQNLDQIGEGTYWYDNNLQLAPMQDYNIGLTKGTENSRLNFSMGYFNQEGVMKYSGVKRYSAKVGIETAMSDKIKIGGSFQPSLIVQNRAHTDTQREDAIGFALMANPVMSPTDANGNLIPYIVSPQNPYRSAVSFPNPEFLLRERQETQNGFSNIGIAFVEWKIIPNLVFKSSFNTVLTYNDYFRFIPSTIGGYNSPPVSGTGNSLTNKNNSFNWLFENTLTYNKDIKSHHFDALVGYTTERSKAKGISITASPYPNDLIETINAAQAISAWGESVNEWSMISYLSRFNYSYKNKYLFTATFRADGSSRFGPENRYAFFPSFAGAWIVSQENFMKDAKAISNLKLRASYGESGNNNIGNYGWVGAVNSGAYVFGNTQVAASFLGLSNAFLTWEESNQVDLGVEIGFLNDRITVVTDLYNRISENMLLNNIIPAITGFNNQIVNKGNVRNRGIELAVNAVPFEGDFKWNFNINFSLNRNEIIAMNDNNDPILAGNFWGLPTNISKVGYPVGQHYGLVWTGLLTAADMADPTVPKDNLAYEGSNKFKDIDGDGKITGTLDYDIIGNPYPDFIYGFTNNLSYKNFNLSFLIQGQVGGNIVDGMHGTIDNLSGAHNLRKEWVNRYRGASNPGDGRHAGVGPTEGWAWKISSLWIEDATYMRFADLTLGYDLPSGIISKTKVFKGINIYGSIHNLALWTKYSGSNPEGQHVNTNNTLAPGYDHSSYPLSRVFSLGINMSF